MDEGDNPWRPPSDDVADSPTPAYAGPDMGGAGSPWPGTGTYPADRRSRPGSAWRRVRVTALGAALVVLAAATGAGISHLLRPGSAAAGSDQGASAGLPGGVYGGFSGRGRFGVGGGIGGGSGGSSSGSGSGPADAAAIADRVAPGVVDVNTSIGYQDAQAAGTGMVLTPDGYVLTNNHVITGATRISVTDVGNGRTYSATVVGYDRSEDVAVLHLDGASGLPTVTLGDPSGLRVGAGVVGVGNAGGTGGAPSYAGGAITGLNQTITASDSADGTSEQLTDLIQTDAGIVAGDSGGPLVNEQGQVIGMDTAASSSFRFSAGGAQAFAIPIDEAVRIARQIEAGRASSDVHIGSTALLGVGVQPGESADGAATVGALVAQVVPGGPADQAGIAAGDTVTSVDGRSVRTPDDLTRIMLGLRPGAQVQVGYADPYGGQHAAGVRLASGPPQ